MSETVARAPGKSMIVIGAGIAGRRIAAETRRARRTLRSLGRGGVFARGARGTSRDTGPPQMALRMMRLSGGPSRRGRDHGES